MKELMKVYGRGLVLGAGILTVVVLGLWVVYGQDIFQVEKDGTPRFKVTADGKIPVGSTGSYENLVIQNNAANPNARVDISADAITVEAVRLESLSVSATITASGAGGLDTGSEAGSTWYYVWVITNNDGSSSNGLFSASSTSPTMPSGYTKKRRVGAVRNDASSNFLRFIQEGNKCLYADAQGILSAGQATTFTMISGASFVPPTSRRAVARVAAVVVHNASNVSFIGRLRETGGASVGGEIIVDETSQVANIVSSGDVDYQDCGVNSSGQFDYRIETAPSGGGGVYVSVAGYYDRI